MLDILCACQNPERAGGIPSWAPDWSIKRTNGPIQSPDQWGRVHFASAPIAGVSYMEPPDDDTPLVTGTNVDTVRQVGDEHTYGRKWDALRENWMSLAATCAWTLAGAPEAGPCYLTRGPIVVAFFETVTIMDDDDRSPENLMKMEIARIEAIERRRFFVTDKGFMALGPAQTRIGDRVIVIHGVHMPFVLRWNVDGGGHAVGGEAYVHGLMLDEALKDDMREAFHEVLGRGLAVEKLFLIIGGLLSRSCQYAHIPTAILFTISAMR